MPGSALPKTPGVPASDEPALTWGVWARHWAVVGVWMVVISYLSTDAFSASNTHRYLDPILRFLFPGITPSGLRVGHALIRKAAHFGEFLVLSGLAFWAFRGGRRPAWSRRWMARALSLAVVYAVVDEMHQMFTMNRTPSAFDSGVDILGAATGQFGLYVRHLLRRPNYTPGSRGWRTGANERRWMGQGP